MPNLDSMSLGDETSTSGRKGSREESARLFSLQAMRSALELPVT